MKTRIPQIIAFSITFMIGIGGLVGFSQLRQNFGPDDSIENLSLDPLPPLISVCEIENSPIDFEGTLVVFEAKTDGMRPDL